MSIDEKQLPESSSGKDTAEFREFRDRVRSQGLWVAGGRGTGVLAALTANAVLPRVLSQDAFADFAVALSIIAFAGGMAPFGLDVVVVRQVSKNLANGARRRASQWLHRCIQMSKTQAVVFGITTALIVLCIGESGLGLAHSAMLSLIIGLTAGLVGYQMVTAESLRSLDDLRAASLFTGGRPGGPIANALFLIAIVLACLFWKLSAVSALTLNAIIILGTAVTAAAVLSRRSSAQFHGVNEDLNEEPFELRDLIRECFPLVLLRGLAFLSMQADLWLAAAFAGDRVEVAHYATAQRAIVFLALPLEICMFLTIATMTRLHQIGKRRELQQILRSATTFAAIPSLAVLAIVLIAGPQLFTWYFGEGYGRASAIFNILAMGQLCAHVVRQCGIPSYHGRQDAVGVVGESVQRHFPCDSGTFGRFLLWHHGCSGSRGNYGGRAKPRPVAAGRYCLWHLDSRKSSRTLAWIDDATRERMMKKF